MGYDPEKGQNVSIEPLGLHLCNDSDIFFEPAAHQKNFIPAAKSMGYCLDNGNDIKLKGNFNSGIASVI